MVASSGQEMTMFNLLKSKVDNNRRFVIVLNHIDKHIGIQPIKLLDDCITGKGFDNRIYTIPLTNIAYIYETN